MIILKLNTLCRHVIWGYIQLLLSELSAGMQNVVMFEC